MYVSNCQYGFRSSMSTSHALLDLVEEISATLDNKKYTLGVFIILKQGFDTVNHSILIKNSTTIVFVVWQKNLSKTI